MPAQRNVHHFRLVMGPLPDVLAGTDIRALLNQTPGKPVYMMIESDVAGPYMGPVPVGEMLAGYESGGETYYLCLLDAYINPRDYILVPILQLTQDQEWRLSRFTLRQVQGILPPVHMVYSDIPAEPSGEPLAPEEVERIVVPADDKEAEEEAVYDTAEPDEE